MNQLERRVGRLEGVANPVFSREELRFIEDLMRRIKAARARIRAYRPEFASSAGPDMTEIPLLPNGRLDIAAALQRSVDWHKAQLIKTEVV